MKKRIATSVFSVLALSVAAMGQPIVKTAPCPTLTRSNTYNGQDMSGLFTGAQNSGGGSWQYRPSTTISNAGQIQNPLAPDQSINCVSVPAGLKAEIVASELTPGPTPGLGYLMYFTFDERGRVWAVDARDYPFQHNATTGAPLNTTNGLPTNRLQGGSRVVILEDTNGDGALDNYKVYFTGLALPTSIEVVKNGVIVTVPPNIYYLPKSGSNADTSGPAQTVVTAMGSSSQTYDTHFQPSSLTRGLDNWFYGHAGGNGCGSPVVGSNAGVTCGNGNIWRFKHTTLGSDTTLFQVYGTGGPSNAHGIGQMEDGQFFKSGATVSSHANHQVRPGVGAQDIRANGGGTTATGTNRFYSMTADRWMWEGNNDAVGTYFSSTTSAVSGHDFYTARLLPVKYWNRFAFTCEGASALCNQDSLTLNGSTWNSNRLVPPSRTPNIFAATDAWVAPLKARTGPDGALWVLDWYNYVFLHNPATPSTNGAWRNPLRAKSRVRLYRIVPENGSTDPVLNLTSATTAQLVATLWNTNFLWRMHAQRLLIERGYNAELGNLLDSVLTRHRTVNTVGLDAPVLHALWTLNGLKRFDVDSARWNPVLKNLLLHPAWTVRRNVVLAMPGTMPSYAAVRAQCAVNDSHAHVRVQALQNLTRMPVSGTVIQSLDGLRSDTHITAAYTAAGASKVGTTTGSARPGTCPAYLGTTADAAGMPPVSLASARSLQTRYNLGYTVLRDGFELMKPHAQAGSGELLVYDLRGQVVFRSAYNAATGQWSQATARNMPHPVYLYAFRGTNGDSFNGRIALGQTY